MKPCRERPSLWHSYCRDSSNNKHLGNVLIFQRPIKDILGGIRSSCTYVGAPSLKQLSKCTTFVRVTKQFNDTFVK